MSSKPSRIPARARKPAAAHAVDAMKPPVIEAPPLLSRSMSRVDNVVFPDGGKGENPPVEASDDRELSPEVAQAQGDTPSELKATQAAQALTEFHADFGEMVRKLPLSALKDVKAKLAKLGVDPASASPACGQALSDAVGRYERKRAKARESSAAKRAAKAPQS